LPESAKRVITQRLQLAQVNSNDRREFDRIVDFMNNGASLDGFILRMKVADLDRKRNQDLRTVEPELSELINYQGPNFNEQ
jgi:hypothetical protein